MSHVILQLFCRAGARLVVCALTLVFVAMVGRVALCQITMEEKLKGKEQQIRRELKNLGAHEWAGEYATATGIDTVQTLVISPRLGYVGNDFGMGDHRFTGTAKFGDGMLLLNGNFGSYRMLEERMLVIDFIGERFLVPYGSVHSFCLQRSDFTSLTFSYFSQRIDGNVVPLKVTSEEAMKAPFSLPKQFEKYRTLPAVTAKVLKVLEKGDCKDCAAKVKLNKGEIGHVHPGMTMSSKQPYFVVTIESITPTHSIGLISPGAKQEIKSGVEFRSSW